MPEGYAFRKISETVDTLLDEGVHDFIIYPFGDIGFQVKQILNNRYGIQEVAIVDNLLCLHNPEVLDVKRLADLPMLRKCVVLISTGDKDLALDLVRTLPPNAIWRPVLSIWKEYIHGCHTHKGHIVGRHTYGYAPLLERI